MEYQINFREALKAIFPSRSSAAIQNIVEIILEEESELDQNSKLERMANLLADELSNHHEDDNNDDDGAIAQVANFTSNSNFITLQEIFPKVATEYLLKKCTDYPNSTVDELIDLINTDANVTEKEADPMEIWQHLQQILPNADPIFLRNRARVLATRPEAELDQFIEETIENNDYPTLQNYLKDKKTFQFYYDIFNVRNYLEEVPNPLEKFKNARETVLLDENDKKYALNVLSNRFVCHHRRQIERYFTAYGHNLTKTNDRMKTVPKVLRTPRNIVPNTIECKNVELLQEILFIRYEDQIVQFIREKNELHDKFFKEAKLANLLETCQVCFNDQLIPDECYFCNKGCIFCKDCIVSGTEVVIGRGEIAFPCYGDCDSEFSLPTLQMALDKKTFLRICQRKQADDVAKAQIDGMEMCPHCDFMMIPSVESKIFKCENVECMKETCRACQHPAHIPLGCNEIEYEIDVQRRTYIENKMTEALLRECASCGKKFYKESGCNKMTCSCGALMCYVCGASIRDYSHFGEIAKNKCPLYTNNLEEFHLNRIRQGALTAKTELGVLDDPSKLKFDPARDLPL